MQNRPTGYIDTAIAYAISALQYLILSTDGQGINDAASVYATRKLIAEREKGKSYFYSNDLTRWWGSMRLFSVDTSRLTTQSLQNISSGHDEPKRYTFAPIEDVVELPNDSPMSWFFAQDKAALQGRRLLANLMRNDSMTCEDLAALDPELLHPLLHQFDCALDRTKISPEYLNALMGDSVVIKRFDLLRIRTANKMAAAIEQKDIPCLYQWMHQITLELISNHVLGLSFIPEYTHTVLDNIEYAIVHESPSFNTFGYRWNLTPSQRRFTEAKNAFSALSRDLVTRNETDVLNGNGYISKILLQEAERLNLSKEEAFLHPDVRKTLFAAAAGSLLAGGALSTAITMALLQLNEEMLQRLTNGDLQDTKEDFFEIFFKEALRYSSTIAHNSRYTTQPKELTMIDGEQITLPADTIIFLDHRRSNQNRETWGDPENFRPERFNEDNAPRINTTRFSPFSLGPRMCPGRQIAEVIFKEVVSCFVKANLFVKPLDPSVRELNSSYWSNEDFMTRPHPGKMISVEIESPQLILSPSL